MVKSHILTNINDTLHYINNTVDIVTWTDSYLSGPPCFCFPGYPASMIVVSESVSSKQPPPWQLCFAVRLPGNNPNPGQTQVFACSDLHKCSLTWQERNGAIWPVEYYYKFIITKLKEALRTSRQVAHPRSVFRPLYHAALHRCQLCPCLTER